MNPFFCFVQLFFYYPFFVIFLYIYLVVFIPKTNNINFLNILSFFSKWIKTKKK
nr:ORF50 [Marchantia emarginata subsp. cuneiloba]